MRPFLVKFLSQSCDVLTDGDKPNHQFSDFFECRRRFLLGEILIERGDKIVVRHTDCTIEGIETGKSVNENTGVLINVEDLERLLKEEMLDESRLVVGLRLLVHGEKAGIFLGIEPHDVAVHGGVNLRSPPSVAGVFTHIIVKRHRGLPCRSRRRR